MQIDVEISLMTEAVAVGRISGSIELLTVPRVGEVIWLPQCAQATGFFGQLRVESVIHTVAADGPGIQVLLEDLVSSTPETAIAIGKALEREYGLSFEQYDNDA